MTHCVAEAFDQLCRRIDRQAEKATRKAENNREEDRTGHCSRRRNTGSSQQKSWPPVGIPWSLTPTSSNRPSPRWWLSCRRWGGSLGRWPKLWMTGWTVSSAGKTASSAGKTASSAGKTASSAGKTASSAGKTIRMAIWSKIVPWRRIILTSRWEPGSPSLNQGVWPWHTYYRRLLSDRRRNRDLSASTC